MCRKDGTWDREGEKVREEWTEKEGIFGKDGAERREMSG